MKKLFLNAIALIAFSATSLAKETENQKLSFNKTETSVEKFGVCIVTFTLTDEDGNIIREETYIDWNSPSDFECSFFVGRMKTKFLSQAIN